MSRHPDFLRKSRQRFLSGAAVINGMEVIPQYLRSGRLWRSALWGDGDHRIVVSPGSTARLSLAIQFEVVAHAGGKGGLTIFAGSGNGALLPFCRLVEAAELCKRHRHRFRDRRAAPRFQERLYQNESTITVADLRVRRSGEYARKGVWKAWLIGVEPNGVGQRSTRLLVPAQPDERHRIPESRLRRSSIQPKHIQVVW
jgi:hypothetical protein